MHLTSPAETPKSQVAGEQPLTGRCWNPPKKKKKILHVQGQRGSHHRQQEGCNYVKIKSLTCCE